MKKFLYYILSGYLILSVLSCQQHRSNTEWLRLADEQVGKSTDSLKTLLSQVKRPLELQGEERLLYGWLSGYLHAQRGTSMMEDSLLVPLADSYIASQDTTRKLLSYWLKARYTGWQKKHEEAFRTTFSEALAFYETTSEADEYTVTARRDTTDAPGLGWEYYYLDGTLTKKESPST